MRQQLPKIRQQMLDTLSCSLFSSMPCRSANALFDLLWHDDGSVSFGANNGKFIGTKRSGHLFANCESTAEENTRYFFYLVNRPVLVLKCDQGFVGYKSSASTKLECNKATYETIQVERAEKGSVHFKGTLESSETFLEYPSIHLIFIFRPKRKVSRICQ